MDHSEDEKLSGDVEQNCDSYQVADRCQSAAHECRPIAPVKHQAPEKWKPTRTGIFQTVTGTKRDRENWLKNKS